MENRSNPKSSILPLILAGILVVPSLWPYNFSYYRDYLLFARGIMLVLSLVFVCKQKTLSIITSIIALLLSVADFIAGSILSGFSYFKRIRYLFGYLFSAGNLEGLYLVLLTVLLLVYAIRPSETKKKLFAIFTFGVLVIVCIVIISGDSKIYGDNYRFVWSSRCFTISQFYTLFAFALSQTQSMGVTKVPTKTPAINTTKTLSSLETLERLAGLKQQGILSNEDYEKKKQEIMRQL